MTFIGVRAGLALAASSIAAAAFTEARLRRTTRCASLIGADASLAWSCRSTCEAAHEKTHKDTIPFCHRRATINN
jgi:hypothetical protein